MADKRILQRVATTLAVAAAFFNVAPQAVVAETTSSGTYEITLSSLARYGVKLGPHRTTTPRLRNAKVVIDYSWSHEGVPPSPSLAATDCEGDESGVMAVALPGLGTGGSVSATVSGVTSQPDGTGAYPFHETLGPVVVEADSDIPIASICASPITSDA